MGTDKRPLKGNPAGSRQGAGGKACIKAEAGAGAVVGGTGHGIGNKCC